MAPGLVCPAPLFLPGQRFSGLIMGRAARPLLDALDIQHFTLRRLDEVATLTDGAIKTAYTARRPVALFLSTEMVGWKKEE